VKTTLRTQWKTVKARLVKVWKRFKEWALKAIEAMGKID